MLTPLCTLVLEQPQSLIAFAVLALAAGMYPVGLMLGAQCSACCRPQPLCAQCEGDYPDTVTVTVSGMPNQTPSGLLCSIIFDSCFGGGAAGQVLAPGGEDAPGPVTGYGLTSGGAGYAKLGREEPEVTIVPQSDAELSLTLENKKDDCGVDYWEVSEITVVDAGTNTPDGSIIVLSTDDTADPGAYATIETKYTEPTVTLSVPGGSGAKLSANWVPIGDPPTAWTLDSITVTDGGSGYERETEVTIAITGQTVMETAALARIDTGPDEPSVTLSVTSSGGSGAVLQAVFGAAYIVDVSVIDGGSGYLATDAIVITPGTNTTETIPAALSIEVDNAGVITAVNVSDIGEYHYEDGTIDSVNVVISGSYYTPAGPITKINLENKGKYWRENADLTPYVAEPVGRTACGLSTNGTGATFSATVDDDPNSTTFGVVTSINMDSPGENYTAFQLMNTLCCGSFWDGTYTLLRSGCEYIHRVCAPNFQTSTATITASLLNSEINRVTISSGACETAFNTAGGEVGEPCDTAMTFTAESPTLPGATVSVFPGGSYNETLKNAERVGLPSSNPASVCDACCKGGGVKPAEVTLSLTGLGGLCEELGIPDLSGDLTLERSLSTAVGTVWRLSTGYIQFSQTVVGNTTTTEYYRLSAAATLTPCANANGTSGWVPRSFWYGVNPYPQLCEYFPQICCDECHNGCATIITAELEKRTITQTGSGLGGNVTVSTQSATLYDAWLEPEYTLAVDGPDNFPRFPGGGLGTNPNQAAGVVYGDTTAGDNVVRNVTGLEQFDPLGGGFGILSRCFADADTFPFGSISATASFDADEQTLTMSRNAVRSLEQTPICCNSPPLCGLEPTAIDCGTNCKAGQCAPSGGGTMRVDGVAGDSLIEASIV